MSCATLCQLPAAISVELIVSGREVEKLHCLGEIVFEGIGGAVDKPHLAGAADCIAESRTILACIWVTLCAAALLASRCPPKLGISTTVRF